MRVLKQAVALIALCTLLTGCLPDNSGAEREEQVSSRREAQATGLARSLSVVGSRAFDSFMTDTASPFVQAASSGGVASMPTQMIDFAGTFGLNMGPAAQQVDAGYCGDPAAGAARSFVVWLRATDANGRFSPAGLGDGATGAVMSRLVEMSDPGSVGIAEGGNLALRDGQSLSLGSCQNTFNIPVGAPVMVFADLKEPNRMLSATTRSETRTVACASGQTGTKTERRSISVQPDGTDDSATAAWTTVVDMCTSVVANLASIALSDSTVNILGSGANPVVGALGSGALKDALDALKNEKCQSVKITKTEKDAEGRTVTKTYDTCSENANPITDITDISQSQAEQVIEYKNGVCSAATWGPSGSLSTNIPEGATLSGSWNSEAWLPNPTGATYKRISYNYDTTNPSSNVSTDPRKLLGKWIGNTLDCKRNEHIQFTCAQFAPNWGSVMETGALGNSLTPLRNEPLKYDRITYVNGWANPEALTPNAPTSSVWQRLTDYGTACAWTERKLVPKVCPLPTWQVNNPWSRIHILTGYGTVMTSDWKQDAELCPDCHVNVYETRVTQCQAGYSGEVHQERTINRDGVCGNDQPWTDTSRNCTRNCTTGGWTIGNWGNCSVSACGQTGYQTRNVQCVGYDRCPGPQPTTWQNCDGICGTWSTGGWGTCMASCGNSGTQTRTVSCSASTGCPAGSQPASSTSCTGECGTWQTDNWTNCDATTCGTTGNQYRNVWCSSANGCSGSAPASSQSCSAAACPIVTCPAGQHLNGAGVCENDVVTPPPSGADCWCPDSFTGWGYPVSHGATCTIYGNLGGGGGIFPLFDLTCNNGTLQ